MCKVTIIPCLLGIYYISVSGDKLNPIERSKRQTIDVRARVRAIQGDEGIQKDSHSEPSRVTISYTYELTLDGIQILQTMNVLLSDEQHLEKGHLEHLISTSE